ncbi:MAG: hypothetical protein AB3N33_13170, partial [Puniceicoccaceae bacterium]
AGNPNLADAHTIAPQFVRTGNVLTLRYRMQRSDLSYRVLTNTVLQDQPWTTTGVIQTPDPDTAAEGTLIEASATLDGNRRFLQLEVIEP